MIRLIPVVLASLSSACSLGSQPAESSDEAAGAVILTVPGMASYIGVWESEDAQLRQAFVIADNGAAVQVCMTAPDEEGAWRIVSQGRYVAEGDEIRGRLTGEHMSFERLDVVGYPVGGDGGIDWVNTATTPEGESVTYETWAAPSAGVFAYVVERGEGVDREFWFAGQWRFRNDLEAECE